MVSLLVFPVYFSFATANPPSDNLRYTAAYCVFGYPNATGVQSSPCTTEKACGHLRTSVQHGIPDPRNSTAFSYCSSGGGEAMDYNNYDGCLPCVSAEGKTKYLANCKESKGEQKSVN